MNLVDALHQLAERFDLDADALIAAAYTDTVGGYSDNERVSLWSCGSIWGVEGQLLYALTRVTEPEHIVQCGGFKGCSTAHFTAALEANGHGRLTSIDLYPEPHGKTTLVDYVTGDALDWCENVMPTGEVGLVLEDIGHSAEETRRIWAAALAKGCSHSFIVSHDAAHSTAGPNVMEGIHQAGVDDPLVLLIEPSDCGLAIWQVP